MKKYIYILLSLIIFSCADDGEDNSFTTYYPTFTYEELVVVELGGSFNSSVTATEDGVNLEVSTSGSVDTNTVGVYLVDYSATNSDGFNGSVTQTVVVHDPSIVGTDVSGDIRDTNRTSRTGVISLVEGTTSIFYCTDFAFGGVFPMYFQMDGDTISEIPQAYLFDVTSVDLTYDSSSKQFTTLVNPYGFEYTFEYY